MKVTFLCIFASIGGIFLKIHVSHFTSFHYEQRKFCCDLTVIIGSFLGEFPGNWPSWKTIPEASHTLPTCSINRLCSKSN